MSKTSSLDKKQWVLASLMCTMMLAAMDATIVSTAIPQIVGDLGGFSLFSWVFSIYLIAQTVTIPIYGKLADIYGRKSVLLFGMVLFLTGSALSAISWNMVSLIGFRFLQGLGAGSIMATVNTLAGDIYTVRERGKIQGWLSSVWGVAAIVGPTLGGWFAEYASWRWIFLVNIPIGFVAILLLIVFLKENFEKKPHHIDYPGACMMFISGTVLIYTLMQSGQSWPWLSWMGIGMITLSIILVILTILIEIKSREPIMPTWIWSKKILAGSNLAVIFFGAILLGPGMYLPIYAQSVLGLGAMIAGFILASSSIGWPIASSLSSILYLKIGFRNTAMIGSVVIFLSVIAFIWIPFHVSPWLLVADQILLGAGFGLLSTPTLVGVQSIVPWEKRGVVTGANMFSRYLGQSVGAAILGSTFNTKMSQYLLRSPENIQAQLPNVNDVIHVLQSGNASVLEEDFLRHGFYQSTHAVYLIMAGLAVLIFLFLTLLPKRFPIIPD